MIDKAQSIVAAAFAALDTPSGHIMILLGLLITFHACGNREMQSQVFNCLLLAMNLKK